MAYAAYWMSLQTTTPGERQKDDLTPQAAVGSKALSQPRQYSPTSVAQVAVNPTQFESASAATTMATKPGTTSVTMTGATGSGVKAGGSVAIAGTTLTGAVKGAEGVPTTPSKADVVKQHPAKVATTVTAPVGPSGVGSLKGPETKVQVEVAPPGAQTAKQELADPFNALADYLPSSQPLNPNAPEYTGPEVTEHVVTSSKSVICGGGDVPLPPGYRFENTAPVADVKPKEVPKPISTDEALDSLSFGFTTSSAPTPPKQEKKAEQFAPAPVTKSAVPPADKKAKVEKKAEQFAPAPVTKSAVPPADKTAKVEKKAEQFAPAPVTKSAVPPADKTAKVEKKAEHFAPAPVTRSAVPPADKKAKVENDFDDFSLITGLDSPLVTKPKTDEGGFMSLDALSALGDTLGAPEPVPESPKIRPEDIVTEDPLAKTKGVLVGERDDTLPPEYRFTEDKVRNLPPPKPEPSMDSGEALDILSGDFMSPSVAHGVQAPILCPPAPPTQAKVKDSSPLSGGIVASSTASTVQAPMVPPQNKPTQVPFCTKEVTKKAPVQAAPVLISTADQDMSLDALEALGDTLGAPEPVPESPKIRPEDIVTEDPLAKTKGVLVGEREYTLPPEYRFTEDKVRNLPPPKPEPSMDSGEALDILSGDFMSPSVAHGVQAPILCPPAPPTQAKVKDSSPLSGGIVASSTASTVQAPMVPPQNKPPQAIRPVCTKEVTKKAPVQAAPVLISTADQDMSLDALEALGDTLGAPEPVPESPKIRPEDIVTEDPLAKTKGVLVGERDDTLPPEYRFTEDKVRNLPPLKPEPSMDSGEALDILSGDFMSPSVAHGVQAPILCPPAPPTQSSGDFALDALAGDFAAPSVAPTVKSAADRQLSTGTADALDVLSNTLMDLTPVVQPAAPVAAKDIVKEKKVTEEKVIKMGERDDSLPPEYRPTKEDKKATADAKARIDVRPKQPSMDDSTALDLLSSDFSTPAATTAVTKTTEQRQPSQVPMSGPVLDDLSDTLLPDSMTSKGGKPKSKSKSKSKSKKQREDPAALDHLSGQPSSDVVPASTNKGGKS
ncbi:calpastatin isoform X7 [Esox lucius]|uniref:Calpastatin n=1 Tax=Esox lucius TaxID=8010 RepID=A0AAY5K3Z0_ESOLU|nr:calpastatin isoform X7 [Esox lucius]